MSNPAGIKGGSVRLMPTRGGVDDEVALGELFAEGTLFKGNRLEAFGRADQPVTAKI